MNLTEYESPNSDSYSVSCWESKTKIELEFLLAIEETSIAVEIYRDYILSVIQKLNMRKGEGYDKIITCMLKLWDKLKLNFCNANFCIWFICYFWKLGFSHLFARWPTFSVFLKKVNKS